IPLKFTMKPYCFERLLGMRSDEENPESSLLDSGSGWVTKQIRRKYRNTCETLNLITLWPPHLLCEEGARSSPICRNAKAAGDIFGIIGGSMTRKRAACVKWNSVDWASSQIVSTCVKLEFGSTISLQTDYPAH